MIAGKREKYQEEQAATGTSYKRPQQELAAGSSSLTQVSLTTAAADSICKHASAVAIQERGFHSHATRSLAPFSLPLVLFRRCVHNFSPHIFILSGGSASRPSEAAFHSFSLPSTPFQASLGIIRHSDFFCISLSARKRPMIVLAVPLA